MKYKYLVAVLIILVLAASPRILLGLGTFLVVDEEVRAADAVVTGDFFGKALTCYKQGRCEKVVVALEIDSPENWQELTQYQSENFIRDQAKQAGIKDEDIYLLHTVLDNDLATARIFKEFFMEKKIRSAIFLSSYYKTRRQRFYLDRVFSGSGIAVYVQPYKNGYHANFEGWWKKTTYANYFLDEYLRMAWYVFNKLLWTSAV